jgi:hypothetical protein
VLRRAIQGDGPAAHAASTADLPQNIRPGDTIPDTPPQVIDGGIEPDRRGGRRGTCAS